MDMTGGMAAEVQVTRLDRAAELEDGFPVFDAERVRPASLEACADAADVLDYVCGAVRGSYLRGKTAEGLVVLRLKTGEGDVLRVQAETTAQAVALLRTRAGVTA